MAGLSAAEVPVACTDFINGIALLKSATMRASAALSILTPVFACHAASVAVAVSLARSLCRIAYDFSAARAAAGADLPR
jgi:hypothetical protein